MVVHNNDKHKGIETHVIMLQILQGSRSHRLGTICGIIRRTRHWFVSEETSRHHIIRKLLRRTYPCRWLYMHDWPVMMFTEQESMLSGSQPIIWLIDAKVHASCRKCLSHMSESKHATSITCVWNGTLVQRGHIGNGSRLTSFLWLHSVCLHQ